MDPVAQDGRPSSAGSEWDDPISDQAWDEALQAEEDARRAEEEATLAEQALADFPDDAGPGRVGNRQDVGHDESEEDIEFPRVMRNPRCPTAREVDEHEVTHMPRRDWCRACVYGRGTSDQHRRQMPHPMDAAVPSEVSVPVISIDFTFMGTSKVRAQANPYLALYDNDTGAFKIYRTMKKGVVKWVIDAIIKDLESMGYASCKICIRCDRENSLLAIRDAVSKKRRAPTVPLDVPVRESKSNGAMEKSIRTWQAQFRTLKESLQLKIGRPVSITTTIAEWK